MSTTVGRIKRDRVGARVDRKTPFGNPFVIGEDGTRSEVIEKFRSYFLGRLRDDVEFRRSVEGLRGQRLLCWCDPEPCHAQVIAAWLDREEAP